ncbi:MAG: ATP synthase F0 subunit A [Candidatus Woykebacteria bacterium RBG_13_40_7b]|uniref:ATP synthase subunit a n=1 Tax=Candidatus Woykebacteria bacterium RBG_13_40_7b TaxID=1802594 RepID=A0A1G1W8C4_9BACT|nr:MAG: ATP synthase F0 subunit A [Candidatus Woykebacteria bacterium RBG_13_40_7b]
MEISLSAEKIIGIGTFPITNTLITTWLTMAILGTFGFLATKSIKMIPSGIQNFAEIVVEFLYNTVEDLAGSTRAKRFFPIVATFFIFIISANYFGLLPGFNTIGFYENHLDGKVFIPFFRSVNSDLNVTLALALISVAVTHYYSITTLGIIDYIKRYISLNPANLFVGLLEIVAEITKVLSLSFRLFGNIFAGEALLITMSTLFAFILPLPFMFLELIVGFVQAAIFMMLTLVFMVVLTEKTAH